jgi:FkbM family methyltransferase
MQRTSKSVIKAGQQEQTVNNNNNKKKKIRCSANLVICFQSVLTLFMFVFGWSFAYYLTVPSATTLLFKSSTFDWGISQKQHDDNYDDKSQRTPIIIVPAVISQCTAEQLDIIRYQLPPTECLKFQNRPFVQRCSFSYATRCPESIWLEEHYHRLHGSNNDNNNNNINNNNDMMIGIYVGCNKGMDAVNTMRMLSGDPQYNKTIWKETMQSMTASWHDGVCGQEHVEQFAIPPNSTHRRHRPAQVHCIEPMPVTVDALQRSAKHLGWDQQGFAPIMGAMSIQDGTSQVPSATSDLKTGVENIGMVNWKKTCNSNLYPDAKCETLVTYRLDTYVDKFINNNNTDHVDSAIQLLMVDVEGFDFDVLQGGPKVLQRVQYLEFEYNWMGRWRNQNLADAISMLEKVGFVCYWPGTGGRIWRISGCWLDHYAVRFWSNVACVNQNFQEVALMADRMEELFLATLAKGNAIHYGERPKIKNSRK